MTCFCWFFYSFQLLLTALPEGVGSSCILVCSLNTEISMLLACHSFPYTLSVHRYVFPVWIPVCVLGSITAVTEWETGIQPGQPHTEPNITACKLFSNKCHLLTDKAAKHHSAVHSSISSDFIYNRCVCMCAVLSVQQYPAVSPIRSAYC